MGSQLLPVLANWRPEAAWALFPSFLQSPSAVPNPAANVAEALRYIDSPASRELANRLARHPNRAVAAEALESLQQMSPGIL